MVRDQRAASSLAGLDLRPRYFRTQLIIMDFIRSAASIRASQNVLNGITNNLKEFAIAVVSPPFDVGRALGHLSLHNESAMVSLPE